MKMFTHLAMAASLVALVNSPSMAQGGNSPFSWYLGAHGGVMIFETPRQTSTGIPVVGGHFLITAKRTALLLAVEEGIGSDEQSSYLDPTAPSGVRNVNFNDIRKYSFVLMLYPFKSPAQPFFGLGYGLIHLHNPWPLATLTTAEKATADSIATERGSSGFGTFVAGLQLQAGGIALFGMCQITTSPEDGKLLEGPTHTLSAGLRFSLGSAKESITGGGY
jgi:hypothetical protein